MSDTLSRNAPCGSYYKRRLATAACSADDTVVGRAREIIAAFKENSTGPFVVEGEPIELPVVRSMHLRACSCRPDRKDPITGVTVAAGLEILLLPGHGTR
jgi:hypothetical protein